MGKQIIPQVRMSSHLTEKSALKESTYIDQIIVNQKQYCQKKNSSPKVEKPQAPETSQYLTRYQYPP